MNKKHDSIGEPDSLEGILTTCFGCKKPFRKNPICVGRELDGNKKYSDVTKSGWKAYDKLISCVYALEKIDAIQDANAVIEALDDIISENGAYC